MAIFNWLLKFIPSEYKWSVAIKKVSYTVGKLAGAAIMMGWVGQHVGSKLTPDQITQIQGVAGGITAAGLEALHDWLRVKFPDAKWL